MMRDPQKDNMICMVDIDAEKHPWVFQDQGPTAQKAACLQKCVEFENCTTLSGVWNEWCIGCSMELKPSPDEDFVSEAYIKDKPSKPIDYNKLLHKT